MSLLDSARQFIKQWGLIVLVSLLAYAAMSLMGYVVSDIALKEKEAQQKKIFLVVLREQGLLKDGE